MKGFRFFVAFMAALVSGSMSAQTITANDVVIERGGTADVTFTINSDTKLAIAEFKLILPQGVSVLYDKDAEDYAYKLGSDMTVRTHSATVLYREGGWYYVLVSNYAGKEFKAPSGNLLTLTLVADANAVTGIATMKDILLGDISAQIMNTETVYRFNVTVPGTVATDVYTVAGTRDLTGNTWDETVNPMTLNAETGLYEWKAEKITVSNEVQPEFKVVKNGVEWFPAENNWKITPDVLGGEGIYTITITFNPETAAIAVTGVKTAELESDEPDDPVNPIIPGQTVITANDVVIERGGTANVTFTISSETKLAIAEFKLVLPQGVSVLYDEEEMDYVYKLGSAMTTKTHNATIRLMNYGAYYVLVSNSAGKEFKAASGDYLTLTLVADENAVTGVATMKNILLGDIGAQIMNTETKYRFNVTVPGTVATDVYTVAGTRDLTGITWDETMNPMTLNAETGLYVWKAEKITVSNEVQPEFKVVKNGEEWFPAENNWKITPDVLGGEGIYTITITFNPETAAIAVTGVKTAELESDDPVAPDPVNPIVPGQTVITANDVVIERGGTANVTFTISSETKLAIAEFKLVLPQGISVLFDEDEDDYVYKLGKAMTTKTHAATIKQLADGSYYVLVANSAGKEFKYPSGDYLTLTLAADENAVSGVATMKYILLANLMAQQVNTITEGTFDITVTEPASSDTYTVAGTADLTGYNWNKSRNEMTLNAETGLYEWKAYYITVSNEVQPEFKVVKNGEEWFPAENNWKITPDVVGGEGVYTITITFNPETTAIAVMSVKTGEIEPEAPVEPVRSTISANYIMIERSGTAEMTFHVISDTEAATAEFSLVLPKGITLMRNEGRYLYELDAAMTDENCSVTIEEQDDGTFHVLVSNAGKAFKAAAGNLLTLTLVADGEAVSGVAAMKNIVLGDINAWQINTVTETTFFVIVVGFDGTDGSLDGESTGISSVAAGQNLVIYNMKGQRLNANSQQPRKGLYIVNGRKVVK
jgi:hypothetical protein